MNSAAEHLIVSVEQRHEIIEELERPDVVSQRAALVESDMSPLMWPGMPWEKANTIG